MSRVDVETNLLFGIMTLQVGLIEQADLLDAFQRWSRDRSRPLAEFLVERGALTATDRATLDDLVRRHVEKYGGNAEQSLGAVAASSALLTSLKQLGDPGIEATLGQYSAMANGQAFVRDSIATAAGSDLDSDAS